MARKMIFTLVLIFFSILFLYSLVPACPVKALVLNEGQDVEINALVENLEHIEQSTTFEVDRTQIYTNERIIVTLFAKSLDVPLVGYRWRVNLSPNNLCVFIYQQLSTDNEGEAVAIIECREEGNLLVDVSLILYDESLFDLSKVVTVNILKNPADEPGEPDESDEPDEPDEPGEPDKPDTPTKRRKGIWDLFMDRYNELSVEARNLLENIHKPLKIISIFVAFANFNVWTTILYLFNMITNLIGFTKSRKTGVIYNSVTKQPVARAVIRMFDIETNKLIKTSVSDTLGYFWVPEKNVSAKILVRLPGYVFPSSLVIGKEDPPFRYVVKDIVDDISKPFSIPIDPVGKVSARFQVWYVIKQFYNILNEIILFILTLFSGFMFLRYGGVLNILFFILGIIMLIVFVYERLTLYKLSSFGTVYYKNGTEVSNAVIDLYDREFNHLVQRRISSNRGKYLLYVPNGNYVLKCTYQNGAMVEEIGKINNKRKREIFYRKNIYLKAN